MLRWRLISAAVILAIIITFLILDYHSSHPGMWLVVLGWVAVLLGTQETLDLLQARFGKLHTATVYVAASLTFLSAGGPIFYEAWIGTYPADCPVGRGGWPLLGFSAGLLLVVVAELRAYRDGRDSATQLGIHTWAVVYPALLMSFLALLRQIDAERWGLPALVSLIAVVKMSDVGAYFGGRALGRNKLAPHLSPGKTVEGLICGVVTAAVTAWVYLVWLVPFFFNVEVGPDFSWWRAALYGVIVALTGVLGDLTESVLKRTAGRKDSSRWLPGLGGVLDVVDSVLSAAPAAYVCWVVGLLGATSDTP